MVIGRVLCGITLVLLTFPSAGPCTVTHAGGAAGAPHWADSLGEPPGEGTEDDGLWTDTAASQDEAFRKCRAAHIQRNTTDVLVHCPRATERLYAIGVWRDRTEEEVRALVRTLQATAGALEHTDPWFAEGTHRQAIHFLEGLVESGPPDRHTDDRTDLSGAEMTLAATLCRQERADEALTILRRADARLAAIPRGDGSERAAALRMYASPAIGMCLFHVGRVAEAREHLARCVREQREWFGDGGPETPRECVLVATTARRFADAALHTEYPAAVSEETLKACELAADTYRKCLERDPDNPSYRAELAQTLYWIGAIQYLKGQFGGARRAVREAIESRRAVDDGAGTGDTLEADLHLLQAGICAETGETTAAVAEYARAVELHRIVDGSTEDDPELVRRLYGAMIYHGEMLRATGRVGPARAIADEVVAGLEALGDGYDDVVARAFGLQAYCLDETGQTTAARELLTRAAVLLEQAMARHGNDFETRLSACLTLYDLGFVTAQDQRTSASHVFGRASAIAERMFHSYPDDRSVRNVLALAMIGQAEVTEDLAVAEQLSEKAVEILRGASGWQESIWLSETMAMALANLGRNDEARGLVEWLVSGGLRSASVRDLARRTGVEMPGDTPSSTAR